MREKILYIVCMAFTALLFSCSKDAMDDELLPVTRAQLSIGLCGLIGSGAAGGNKIHPVYCVQQRVGRREAECE